MKQPKQKTPSKKFSSYEQLEQSYLALEKEFTKKCQIVSVLQKQIQKNDVGTSEISPPTEQSSLVSDPTNTVDQKESSQNILGLEQSLLQALPPVITGNNGNMSLAMPTRPKTIEQASMLAKEYFK